MVYCWHHSERPAGHYCAPSPEPSLVDDGPYRGKVADLVNPYMSIDSRLSGGNLATGAEYAVWWLQRHPGRWGLIGEGGLGVSPDIAKRLGLTVRRTGGLLGKVYGTIPHPEAEDLKDALRRTETRAPNVEAL